MVTKRNKVYLVECWLCGCSLSRTSQDTSNRAFCEVCEKQYLTNKEEVLLKYVSLKTEVMHERALRYMEKQKLPMHDYKEASQTVLEFAKQDSTKFDSSPEMMAAMELIRNEIGIKMQYKVKRHSVDMLIPSMKVALEIDGHMHQYKVLNDSMRDVNIIEELGKGWEVIRIPVKHIEENLHRLIPAIKAVYKEKQRLRSKHNGFIPASYSKREKVLHDMIEEQNG